MYEDRLYRVGATCVYIYARETAVTERIFKKNVQKL